MMIPISRLAILGCILPMRGVCRAERTDGCAHSDDYEHTRLFQVRQRAPQLGRSHPHLKIELYSRPRPFPLQGSEIAQPQLVT
jgi:hypothetical protein